MRASRLAPSVRFAAVVAAAAGFSAGLSAASAQNIEVIYTKIPTHPTSLVPGARDLAEQPAATRFRALEDLFVSPDGSLWMLKGRTQQGGDLENIMLLGSGTSGTMWLQEGQPVPGGAPGELIDFFGSGVGRFDELNRFALSLRARGGTTATAQKVIAWDGEVFSLRFQQGDLYFGLLDQAPNVSGDERIGNSIGSIHLLNDGRIGAHDTTIQNLHSSRRPALFYNLQMFHQINVTTVLGMDGVTPETWLTMDANRFYTTPDGAHWMATGRMVGMPTSDTTLVYDGQIVLRTGVPIGDSGVVVNGIFQTELAADGTWFARGSTTTGGVFAVRNGELVAATGRPVIDGEDELWGTTFLAFTGNRSGDWVLAGTTDNPDAGIDTVIVLNGDTIVAREGDPVDLDGNGEFDDDVFIGRGTNTLAAFEANDLALTDDRMLYFIANIRNGAGQDLNSDPAFVSPQAFMRVDLGGGTPPECPADWNNDNVVNSSDLSAFITSWLDSVQNGNLIADFNNDGFVNSTDLSAFITAWLHAVQNGC